MWSMLDVDVSSITEPGPLRVVGALLGLGAKGMRIEIWPLYNQRRKPNAEKPVNRQTTNIHSTTFSLLF